MAGPPYEYLTSAEAGREARLRLGHVPGNVGHIAPDFRGLEFTDLFRHRHLPEPHTNWREKQFSLLEVCGVGAPVDERACLW